MINMVSLDIPRKGCHKADEIDFTFALERGRSYTIGRDKASDIQFNSKRLRTLEGTFEIGDWSLTDVSFVIPAMPIKLMKARLEAFGQIQD